MGNPELIPCPRCGALHSLDEDQSAGEVSCICTACGFHYYQTGDKRLE